MSTVGDQLATEGIARAARGASPEWKEAMYALTVEVARTHRNFTADDVYALADARGIPPTHENRAYGHIARRAARADICIKTTTFPENRKSIRPQLHSTPLQIWDSLVYDDPLRDIL